MNSAPSYNLLRYRYAVKSMLPSWAVLQIRQAIARRMLPSVSGVWPILESAGSPPPEWAGWPDGKRFSVIISHDVDTRRGLERCRLIADLEERMGFRSAFYFVPKGRYEVPESLRNELVARGFEVGVHGLYHDWRTFTSRDVFARRAPRINYYLRNWGAEGFRAPSMIRNLDWIGELNIDYDASTFDTDPFEPQPGGVGTIFPIWMKGRHSRPGYVELPYTLPQDYTLFVLLQATGIDVWKRKLAWIVKKGGMAFCDVHPCYADPSATACAVDAYPMEYYEAFLKLIKTEYRDQYWHVLPRELATWWRAKNAPRAVLQSVKTSAPRAVTHHPEKIWIDLDNTPHVPFFRPIIRELKDRGFDVVVTARDAFQVWELADRMGVDCTKIGRHYGKHQILKGIGLCYRASQLAPLIRREKPILAVSHGSRSQVILSSLLRIPSVIISDYEHARSIPFFHPTYHIIPDVIPDNAIAGVRESIFHYPGIKENVYAPDFVPDSILLHELGIRADETVVAVRPPATEAHYRAPLSDILFDATMSFLLTLPAIRIILVPRNKKQGDLLGATRPAWFMGNKTIVPGYAVDGLNLLWHSDVVISGGGTMNREAVALGVPVYSIFGGAIGAVDQYLSDIGKLTIIRNPDELPAQLKIMKRDKTLQAVDSGRETLRTIVSHIVGMAEMSTAHLI